MDFNKEVKEKLEGRIKRLEDFIEDNGIGSTRLKKARKIQRNLNVAVLLGSLVTAAGVTIWALNSNNKSE